MYVSFEKLVAHQHNVLSSIFVCHVGLTKHTGEPSLIIIIIIIIIPLIVIKPVVHDDLRLCTID